MINEVLRLEQVSISTPPHQIFNVNLDLSKGEILAVLEQSGKSFDTLIQLMMGAIPPDSGRIYFEERDITASPPLWNKRLGIYCIQPQPHLIYGQSIAENICIIGDINKAPHIINYRKNNKITRVLLDEFGLSRLKPSDTISKLPISTCYLIEILRCRLLGIKVLLIGDILFNFPPGEYEKLIAILKKLSSLGTSIVLFSNSYSHFPEMADRIDILRNNTVTAHLRKPLPDKGVIKSMLSGLPFPEPLPESSTEKTVEDTEIVLRWQMTEGAASSQDKSLYLKKGEIVGIMDLSSDHSLSGLPDYFDTHSPISSTVVLKDSVIRLNEVSCSGLPHIRFIPSVNLNDLMFYNLSLMDNITVDMPKEALYPGGYTSSNIRKYLYKNALSCIRCEYLIPLLEKYAELPHVSKVIQMQIMFARAVCAKASVIMLMQPYDSYDSINIRDLKQLLYNVCALGISVIMISTNYSSLSDTCSRIYVLDNGFKLSKAKSSPPAR